MDPHDVHHKLYNADHRLKDPGNGKTITVDRDLAICEMVSAAAETRTLAEPSKAGIQFVLRMLTDGGDIVVTTTGSFLDGLGKVRPKITFDDAGDFVTLISVKTTTSQPGTHRWQIMDRKIILHA